MCMALYNDRVRSWEKSLDMDEKINSDPTYQPLNELVTLDERNRLAHLELENYEKHSTFLFLHPLLQDQKLTQKLNTLRTTDPEEFMSELTRTKQYISRYSSQIKNKKYTDQEDLIRKQEKLSHYTHKYDLMTRMISRP